MKQLTLKNLLIYMAAVLTPIYSALFWLGILIFLDLITGLFKARKIKEPITSNRLKNTLSKTLFYFIVVLAAQIMDSQFITLSFLPAKVAQLVAGFVAVIEFKSIIENANILLGQNIWDLIKSKINAR